MFSDLIGKSHTDVGMCAGLASIACARLGIDLPDWSDICIDQAQAEIEKRKELFEAVEVPQPGDLVHIRSMDDRHHVAVVINRTHMIQSTSANGVHMIRIDHPWLASRLIGFYRYAA